jgi:hypothetical protein
VVTYLYGARIRDLDSLAPGLLTGALVCLGMTLCIVIDPRFSETLGGNNTILNLFLTSGVIFLLMMANGALSAQAMGLSDKGFRFGKLSAILFVGALVSYALASKVYESDFKEELRHPPRVDGAGRNGREALKRALKSLVFPVGVSGAVTALTYLGSKYPGGLTSHATVFGVYFAVALGFQDRTEAFKKSLPIQPNVDA